MKSLVILIILVLSTSCASDDDNYSASDGELTVTIDDEINTSNSLIVNSSFDQYTSVRAILSNSPDIIITLDIYNGEIGSDALYFMRYHENGVTYGAEPTDNGFTSTVTVNDGSKIDVTFAFTLLIYDSVNDEDREIVFSNGSLVVDY